MNRGAWRILDANLNRAREAFRVVEEYARFVRDDAALCRRLKELRHELVAAEKMLPAALPEGMTRADFRDTAGDAGADATTDGEATRADEAAVARAALKRLPEALRALEEYGKIVDTEAAARFEKLRYAVYEIEARALSTANRFARLAQARLYVLVTESLASADAVTVTREAVAGGADIIQMREKELEDGAFYARARELAAICREGGALFLLNDRAHLVDLVDADGVHTGWGDLPIHLVRRLVGRDRVIGRSTAAREWAERAFSEGADYIGAGPVYATDTKKHRAPVGLDCVRWVAAWNALPYFCIGAVNRRTLPEVIAAGARAVAVCTAIIGARDIAAEAAWFKERLVASTGVA